MKIFEELKAVAVRRHEEAGFPSWLVAEVVDIAADPGRNSERSDLIQLLLAQIKEFDPYAGSGCFDESVSADTIGATIGRIKAASISKYPGPAEPELKG